jgi:hypothetical protein
MAQRVRGRLVPLSAALSGSGGGSVGYHDPAESRSRPWGAIQRMAFLEGNARREIRSERE